jgi:hypothetical protein
MLPDDRSSSSSHAGIQQHLERLSAAAAAAAASGTDSNSSSDEQQRWDLGLLLQGLLLRYGEVLDYAAEAVSVNRGSGIVGKAELWVKPDRCVSWSWWC